MKLAKNMWLAARYDLGLVGPWEDFHIRTQHAVKSVPTALTTTAATTTGFAVGFLLTFCLKPDWYPSEFSLGVFGRIETRVRDFIIM